MSLNQFNHLENTMANLLNRNALKFNSISIKSDEEFLEIKDKYIQDQLANIFRENSSNF